MKLFIFLLLLVPFTATAGELQVGERLKYKITFSGLMTLGYAEMTIEREIEIAGAKALVLKTKTWATPFLANFYPVNDRIISHWDPIKKQTLWQEKIISEGAFYREYQAKFDYKKRNVTWRQKGYSKKTTGGKTEGVTEGIPLEFQDALSAVYFSRLHPLQGKPGMRFQLDIFDDLKNSTIKMKLLRIEPLRLTINGKSVLYDTQVIEPVYETTGLFRAKGRMFLWVTNDHNKVPLQIVSEIPVGSVKASLVESYLSPLQ